MEKTSQKVINVNKILTSNASISVPKRVWTAECRFLAGGGNAEFILYITGSLNSSYDKYFENDLSALKFADKKMFG